MGILLPVFGIKQLAEKNQQIYSKKLRGVTPIFHWFLWISISKCQKLSQFPQLLRNKITTSAKKKGKDLDKM